MNAEVSDSSGHTSGTVGPNTDTWFHILSYLEINDLASAESVSKEFQLCANYWFRRQKEVSLTPIVGINRIYLIGQQEPTYCLFPKSSQLDLKANKDRVLSMAAKVPNIEYLALNSIETDYNTLRDVLQAMPSLKRFSMRDCSGLTDEQYRQLGSLLSKNIKEFIAYDVIHLNSNGLIEMVSQMTQLNELVIHLEDLDSISQLFNSLPTSITSLDLHSMDDEVIGQQMIEPLIQRNGEYLQTLYIAKALTTDTLEFIANKTSLKQFGYCLELGSIEWNWHCLQKVAQKQKNLQYLKLCDQYLEELNDTNIRVKTFLRVKKLQLFRCYVTLSTFESLLKCFPNLKELIHDYNYLNCEIQGYNCKTCLQQMYRLVAKFTSIHTISVNLNYLLLVNTALFCRTLNEFRSISTIHLKQNAGFDSESHEMSKQFIEDFIDWYELDPQKVFEVHIYSKIKDLNIGPKIPRNLKICRDLP